MKALIYLIKRTAANNLKKAVRKPTTLLALIFGAAYGIFLIVMLGTLAVTVRIDSVQGLVILVTVWTIYITVGNFMSYASRKGILFRPAHSQFVFPAPISPKLVLIQGAWMNYLMSFFIWIVLAIGGLTVFHVEWWKMLFFFLIGCGVECAVEQSVMIILYTNDKLPQKLIKGICFGMKVFLIAFTLMIVLYFKEKGLSVESALSFINWPPEIAELLEKDEITISVASEICRYGTDIQKEVYYKHLKDSDSMLYDCWRGLKAAEVAKFIERDFTTDLSRYAFDKTLCASCPHNTNNMMLFCEGGCGNCANRSCLAEMNASYLVEKAVQFVEQYPSVSLCYQDFNNNMIAVERLTAMGYEVEHLNTYATPYPETPVAPEKEEYDTIEEYEEAYKEYEQDFSNYMEKCKSIHERIDTGELTFYISIGQKEITLCYMASAAANADMATEKQLSPVEKLEKQDKRNKEIAVEKTVADAKKQILDVDMSESKFTQDEEKMIYFFLLSSLRREHFGVFGIGEKKATNTLRTKKR